MPVLLTLDLLGSDSRYRQGGPGAAAALFDDFADLVLDTAATLDVSAELRGDIEADWCGLVCPSVESALALARRIFRRAWLDPRSSDDLRLWIRGAVTPTEDDAVRHTAPDDDLAGIRRTTATPGLMRALAALRSGFQGMRILVDEALLTDPLRGMFRVPLGRLGLIPFRRMNFTPYPPNLKKTMQDFLWMAETPAEWNNYVMRMKQRVLWSAADPVELEQAAATQIVFHETDAIVQSVVRKNQMRREDGGGSRGPRREREREAGADSGDGGE
ncbi:MAG: hypothetical protein AB7O97_20935 [Planctomycetota bacterium]